MKTFGLENGDVIDSHITVSSQLTASSGPSQARLHLHPGPGKAGAWVAKDSNKNQWLAVDILRVVKIRRISTQGRQDKDQWVTSYGIEYSRDGVSYKSYQDDTGKEKVTNCISVKDFLCRLAKAVFTLGQITEVEE